MKPLPDDIDAYFELREKFPRARWDAMRRRIDAQPGIDTRQAWLAFEFEWLTRLRAVLGESYFVSSSKRFLFLAGVPEAELEPLQDFADGLHDHILAILAPAGAEAPWGIRAIFVFPDQDAFYDYISAAYPEEGFFLQTDGLFMREGCGHFAVFGKSLNAVAADLAHEMCHAAVSHLPLPRWLDEGLACVIGARLWHSVFALEPWVDTEHLPWLDRHIQDFWSGRTFDNTEDEMEFVSNALLLVSHLFDDEKQLKAFLLQADWRDGGDEAARLCLKKPLGEVATEVFGEGDWQPRPELWTPRGDGPPANAPPRPPH